MYICLCNAVTESAIREAIADGAHSLAELSARTGVSNTCGACSDATLELLEETLGTKSSNVVHLPVIHVA